MVFFENFLNARVAEQVDATDLKSVEAWPRAGSIPASGTNLKFIFFIFIYDFKKFKHVANFVLDIRIYS